MMNLKTDLTRMYLLGKIKNISMLFWTLKMSLTELKMSSSGMMQRLHIPCLMIMSRVRILLSSLTTMKTFPGKHGHFGASLDHQRVSSRPMRSVSQTIFYQRKSRFQTSTLKSYSGIFVLMTHPLTTAPPGQSRSIFQRIQLIFSNPSDTFLMFQQRKRKRERIMSRKTTTICLMTWRISIQIGPQWLQMMKGLRRKGRPEEEMKQRSQNHRSRGGEPPHLQLT